jgi:hypothetical protein
VDPETGRMIVEVDDPDGGARFVREGGDWRVEPR